MHRSLLPAVLSLSILLSTLVAAQDASYTFTTIAIPTGVNDTYATAINTHSQLAGYYLSAGSDAAGVRGFLYDPDQDVLTTKARQSFLYVSAE